MMDFEVIVALVKTLLEWRYSLIALAMFLDGTISPVPGEVMLILAGYLLYLKQLNFFLVVLSAIFGSLLAAQLLYELSRRYGETLFRKYGKYVLLDGKRLKQSEEWFTKYGERTVFIGRLFPVISQLISIPAGMAKMPRLKFILYTCAGSALWYGAVTLVSWWLGSRWNVLLTYLQPLQLATIVLLACVAVAIILRKLFGKYIDRITRTLRL